MDGHVDLLSLIKKGAEQAPTVMENAESDWVPIFMYETGEGQVRSGAITDMTPETIPLCAEGLKGLLIRHHAVQVALVLPIWMTEFSETGVEKTERVLVTHVDRDGTRVEAAVVFRHHIDPPRLGRWDREAEGLDVGGGLFVDALREAIR